MTPLKFKRFLQKAIPGAEFTYAFRAEGDEHDDPDLLTLARDANDRHEVILFQRRCSIVEGARPGWCYVARRVSNRAAGWLEAMENWHEDYAPGDKARLASLMSNRLCLSTVKVEPIGSYPIGLAPISLLMEGNTSDLGDL